MRIRTALLAALLLPGLACSAIGGAKAQVPPVPVTRDSTADTLGSTLVPAGYGSLRQDDIAIKIQLQSVLVKALPLDEAVIRMLAPDLYKSLAGLKASKLTDIDARARRYGAQQYSLWYVQYFGLEPDARFSPMEFLINSAGRDFRPVDVVPLSNGFGEQRLKQREVQAAIFIFDRDVDVTQPLTVTIEGAANSSWGSTVQLIERERSLIRSRAARTAKPPE